eukprot:c1213_g1_i1.p1 GENE.c1213_g1_i1~~c1213_g1_i1.p1  ORF type:complete len:545 (+),score=129.78 c1213_g1_i1:124-1635(+)
MKILCARCVFVAFAMLASVSCASQQRSVGLGTNSLLPLFSALHDINKETTHRDLEAGASTSVLRVRCDDGHEVAGLNVDEDTLRAFVNDKVDCECLQAQSCVVSATSESWTQELMQDLHQMWLRGDLVTPMRSPGIPIANLCGVSGMGPNVSKKTAINHFHLRPGSFNGTQPVMLDLEKTVKRIRGLCSRWRNTGDLEQDNTTNVGYFGQQLMHYSHEIGHVLDHTSKDSQHTLKVMRSALGDDVFSLNHPSREAAQEVLNRIKHNFLFFHGNECLQKSFNGTECGSAVPQGSTSCNAEESEHMCSYVELYKCDKCGAQFRFARYRSVPKLLETKVGRCGEFSDVALAAFRLLGYESRQVVDHTDHVWVEIALEEQGTQSQAQLTATKKFVHADPSEGVLDNPFMYVDGWKKQFTFVLAHTSKEIEDRSDSYSHAKDHTTLVGRRGMSDNDLEKNVKQSNQLLQREAARAPTLQSEFTLMKNGAEALEQEASTLATSETVQSQ